MSDLIRGREIWLFGTIVPDEYIWPGETGFFSARMVVEALSQMQGDVTAVVNCDGGSPSEGEAIRAAFEAHSGTVTARVTGNAHSAASLMIMSADRIEMSMGSLMLVHDPSMPAFGTEDQLRQNSETLGVMATSYAGVYAARAGISTDAAREIMRAETMYTAETAVAANFADAVIGDDAVGDQSAQMKFEIARHAVGAAIERVHQAQMKFEDRARDGAPCKLGHAPQTQEVEMTTPNAGGATAVTTTGDASGAAPVVTSSAPAPVMQADPIAAERARVRGIRESAAPFMAHIGQAELDRMIDDGTSLDVANRAIMASVAAAQPRGVRAEIRRDEGETQIEGLIGALMHRAAPHVYALEGPSEQFRGIRLRSLAMHLAGRSGGFNEVEIIRSGMRSTTIMSGAQGVSDFSYITTEVMNRTLRDAYARRPSTWRRISRQRSAADFREMHSITSGGDFQLKPVGESGEYLQSTITDEAQGLKVAKYGRQINLTFEAIINDDMGVFERLPTDYARAASTLESKTAWSVIRGNATLKGGKSLFHADHGNIGDGADINVTTVGDGRKAMWEQRAAGSNDKDDFLMISPDLLFVPPELETAAGQFVAATAATKSEDVNPYSSTVSPIVEPSLGASAGGSDSTWYLFASDMPVLEHAYLDGYEAPTVMTKEGMNPDGVNMIARHIFGASPVEYRGAYRRG